MPLCRKVSAIRYSIIFANEMQADFILFFAVRPSEYFVFLRIALARYVDERISTPL